MKLAETAYDNSATGCCAPVDHARWHHQRFEWDRKPFLKDHVTEVMHFPLNFGAVMSRDHVAIEAAAAWPEHPFTLSDDSSPWGADVYTAVEGDVPDGEVVTLSGTFLSKVYEGPFRDIPKWMADMATWVAAESWHLDQIYFNYATCPSCAKAFGRNEVVLVAKVSPPPR